MALTSKLLLGWKNCLEDMTLTSSIAAQTLHPLSNVISQLKGRPARWDVTAASTLTLNATSATEQTITGLMVKGHNLTKATTARLRIYAGESQSGTVVYDSDLTPGADEIYTIRPWGEMIAGYDPWGGYCEETSALDPVYCLVFETVKGKSIRLDITLASQPEDIVEQTKTVAGGFWTASRPVRRRIDIDFGLMEDQDRNRFLSLLGEAGKGRDLYVIPDPNDVGYSWHLGASIYRRTNDFQYQQLMFNGSASQLALREN
jgi:hypothetical protein